jgi:hypothetical protein
MMSGFREKHGGGNRTPAIRCWLAWLFALVYVLQSGCASLSSQVTPTAHQANLGKVAIVSPNREPELAGC